MFQSSAKNWLFVLLFLQWYSSSKRMAKGQRSYATSKANIWGRRPNYKQKVWPPRRQSRGLALRGLSPFWRRFFTHAISTRASVKAPYVQAQCRFRKLPQEPPQGHRKGGQWRHQERGANEKSGGHEHPFDTMWRRRLQKCSSPWNGHYQVWIRSQPYLDDLSKRTVQKRPRFQRLNV